MRNILLFFCLLFCATAAAQYVNYNTYLDYINHKTVINPERDVKPLVFGIIDKEGNVLVPFEYEDIMPSIGGIYHAKKASGWGAIDSLGNVVIPFTHPRRPEIRNNYIIACDQEMNYGIYDHCGKILVPFKYKSLRPLSSRNKFSSLLRADKGNKSGVIDFNGNIIVPFMSTDFCSTRLEGGHLGWKFRFILQDRDRDESWKTRALDTTGRVIIPYIKYARIKSQGNQTLFFQYGNNRSPQDEFLSTYIPTSYLDKVSNPKTYLYDTKRDKLTILKYYDRIIYVCDKFAVVDDRLPGSAKDDNAPQVGIISMAEGHREILPMEYAKIEIYESDIAVVKNREGEMGLFRIGDQAVPILPFGNHPIRVEGPFALIDAKKDGHWGAIRLDGEYEQALPPEYMEIEISNSGTMAALQNQEGLWGLVALDGKNTEILPYQYWSMSIDANDAVTIKNTEGLCGLWRNGKMIAPIKYDDIYRSEYRSNKEYYLVNFSKNRKRLGSIEIIDLAGNHILNSYPVDIPIPKKDEVQYGIESINYRDYLFMPSGFSIPRDGEKKHTGKLVVNSKGETVLAPDCEYLEDHLSYFEWKNKDQVPKESGALNPMGQKISPLPPGVLVMRRDGKWGLFDLESREMITSGWEIINGYHNGMIVVGKSAD